MFSKLIIVGTIVAFAAAHKHPVNSQIVNKIRNSTTRWAAHDAETNPLRNYSIEKIRGMMGTIVNPPSDGIDREFTETEIIDGVPDNWDWRIKSTCVHPIRDQAQCGSCWAFAASEALSDRFCIASNNAIDVVLSPQDLVQCDAWDRGCNGGILSWAWDYIVRSGVVAEECAPYTSGNGVVPSCPAKCANGDAKKKYGCNGPYSQSSGIEAIKSEVFARGPVETGFTVYEDFMNYQTGIYHYTSGSQLGGHAVKIIGWGQDAGVNYWICANSWSEKWGMQGFFNIEFGQCGIDNAAFACAPKI